MTRRKVRIPQLALHPNQQWFTTRRVNGVKKFYYFGTDQDRARAEFVRTLPEILAGRQPGTAIDPSRVAVLELADRFVVAQEGRLKDGEIGHRHFDDLRRAAEFFAEWAGHNTPTAAIPPLAGYRSFLLDRMKLHAFNRNITNTRALLHWGWKHKPPLLPIALHDDDAMHKAKAKHVRRERRETEEANGKPIYWPHECRAQVLAAATAENWELLSFILLGLNAGMGQTHIAELPRTVVNLKELFVDWVRPKTEEICQFPLWPITAETITRATARRPKPLDPADGGLCFVHPSGRRWAWVSIGKSSTPGAIGGIAPNDEIGRAHAELEAGLTVREIVGGETIDRPMKKAGRAFYAFRRTFSTIGNDVPDKDAVRRVMGHGLEGNDPSYVRHIPRERLAAVVDHVHRRLFGVPPADLSLGNLTNEERVDSLTADIKPA